MKIALHEGQSVLAAVCGVLGLILAYQLLVPERLPHIPLIHLHERQPAVSVPASFAAPPPSQFSDIDSRPLFSADRKPIARDAGPAAKPATLPPPNLTLIGIIRDGDKVLALVRAPGAAFATSLGIGASVGGWRVSDIKPDRMVLHAGTTDHEILLNSNAPPPSGR